MSLELTVRGKTYKVEVTAKGEFWTYLDEDDGARSLSAETLKGLETKLTAATRARTAKVALKFKRLIRRPAKGSGGYRARYRGYGYRGDEEDGPWEVIEVTVRGINEHTGHPMVTWPDGHKGDDEEVGRYNADKAIYFPSTMNSELILSHQRQVDEHVEWLKKNQANVMDLARKAVAKALGE